MTHAKTPFHDLDATIALPRLNGLALSPDGTRLATVVSTLDPTRTRYVNAVWELDPTGEAPARRVTRSGKGESGIAYAPDNDLYFLSARPDPDAKDEDPSGALWVLPGTGGEARLLVSRAGGVDGVTVASGSGTVFVTAGVLRAADAAEDPESRDAELRKERKEKKISAILHTASPVRYWDQDLGPALPHVLRVTPDTDVNPDLGAAPDKPRATLTDLTRGIGAGLLNSPVFAAPGGSFVLVNRVVPGPKGQVREPSPAWTPTAPAATCSSPRTRRTTRPARSPRTAPARSSTSSAWAPPRRRRAWSCASSTWPPAI